MSDGKSNAEVCQERKLRIGESVVDPETMDWVEVWKRPVKVEAVKIPAPFEVETMEGTMEAESGHYLLRGVEGELYPCDPGVFGQTYIRDKSTVPKYAEEDLNDAMRELRENTLDKVPTGVTDTDARCGARALLSLLRGRKG